MTMAAPSVRQKVKEKQNTVARVITSCIRATNTRAQLAEKARGEGRHEASGGGRGVGDGR